MITKKESSLINLNLNKFLSKKEAFINFGKTEQTKYLSYFFTKIISRNYFSPQEILSLFNMCHLNKPKNIFDIFNRLRQQNIFIPYTKGNYILHKKEIDNLDKEFNLIKEMPFFSERINLFDTLDIHPKIREVSEKRFFQKDYSVSVERAFKRVIKLVQEKSNLRLDGTKLMERAFSVNKPVLKFNNLETESDLNEQEGMMSLFRGSVKCIRNVRFHEEVEEDDEKTAFHYLVFASFLLKKLDETFD